MQIRYFPKNSESSIEIKTIKDLPENYQTTTMEKLLSLVPGKSPFVGAVETVCYFDSRYEESIGDGNIVFSIRGDVLTELVININEGKFSIGRLDVDYPDEGADLDNPIYSTDYITSAPPQGFNFFKQYCHYYDFFFQNHLI